LRRRDRDRRGAARGLVRAAARDQWTPALGRPETRGRCGDGVMSATSSAPDSFHAAAPRPLRAAATHDAPWVRALLIGAALLFLGLFLLLPLATVFIEALAKGV